VFDKNKTKRSKHYVNVWKNYLNVPKNKNNGNLILFLLDYIFRYCAIVRKRFHDSLFSRARTKVILIFIWGWSNLLTSPTLFGWSDLM